MSRSNLIRPFSSISALFLLTAIGVSAQTTRPRRTGKQTQKTTSSSQAPASDPLLKPEPVQTTATRKTSPNDPLLTVQPVQPVENTVANTTNSDNTSNTSNTVAPADTKHAYLLLEQKQFAAAAKEAKSLTEQHPNDPEAWKIAGFAELNLKQYTDAATHLQKAVTLQRQAKQPDPNTESALGQAYVLSEKYQEALPLLVAATDRAGGQPDATMMYYRGISEYKTGKTADAEKSFNTVVKLNPKDSISLFYLAQISLAKNDVDGAIATLNRATLNDSRMVGGWTLLTSLYLRRAATSTDQAKADADYLNAVRAGEGLIKVKTDVEAVTLFGQALIGAKQYPRAAAALERASAGADATGVTFYLLGVAHSRATNFPKAIAALETAAKKSPDDPNVYREPGDTDFKESIERVKPVAKP